MTTIVAVGFIEPPNGGQPVAREGVIFGEIGELVPVVVDRVDHALVRARQRALELQVVGRIGKDEIDRRRRKPRHLRHAVADQDRVARSRALLRRAPGGLQPGVSPRRRQYAKPEAGRGGGTLRHARYASTQPLDA